jgi:hypothetical protein
VAVVAVSGPGPKSGAGVVASVSPGGVADGGVGTPGGTNGGSAPGGGGSTDERGSTGSWGGSGAGAGIDGLDSGGISGGGGPDSEDVPGATMPRETPMVSWGPSSAARYITVVPAGRRYEPPRIARPVSPRKLPSLLSSTKRKSSSMSSILAWTPCTR